LEELGTDKPSRGPRSPSRNRGFLRFAALLDAVEELLQTESPDAIGLYQIAQRAGVPPPSVYHFFPSKEAAFVALAERYCDGLLEVHRTPIEARLIGGWQDLARIDDRRAMEFYNAHPPALKIFYGGYGGVETRNIDKMLAIKMSKAASARLNRVFHLPRLGAQARKVRRGEIYLAILDSIWTISVRNHGYITEDYFEESYRATIAYERLYLPEYLEPRAELLEAAERGEFVTLPYDGDNDGPLVESRAVGG
jgi:AcrR family transcriptional regulator